MTISKNDDPDICLYSLQVHSRGFPYPADGLMYTYHNGEYFALWHSRDGWDKIPRTGDTCPICNREILIINNTTYI